MCMHRRAHFEIARLTRYSVQGKGLFGETKLPSLPSNAQYVYHENECYDWGTFGWLLDSGHVDASKFQYFIFMNSSVRGPFLPPYWPVSCSQDFKRLALNEHWC